MNAPSASTEPIGVHHLYAISQKVALTTEWKKALDEISRLVRTILIYDNLVVYTADKEQRSNEVFYARAAGRGRSAEADAAWGEAIALQAVENGKTILQEPDYDPGEDRLKQASFLAIPMRAGKQILGAMVFIRFGGPVFLPESVELAEFITRQIALLVERQQTHESYRELEAQHQQARLQSDFINNITHELKSPLGFIKGYATTLLRSDTDWDRGTQQEFLRIIDQETDRLLELIGNLLDSSRLQSGQLPFQFQVVRLDALMNDIFLRANIHNPDLQIKIHMPDPVIPIQADPVRLKQVIENLISNAIKYAPGSDILITINQSPEMSKIIFQDFGTGIPEQYLPYIFDRFFRSPDTPNIHGTGLGLFICKYIIHAHGGEITAESEMGKGTTFTIELPPQSL